MNSKKAVIVVISSVIVLCFGYAAVTYLAPFLFHADAVRTTHETEEKSVTNGEYTLSSKIFEDESVGAMYLTFTIKDKNGKTVFDPDDCWRIFDLKYVGFADGTNDVFVNSADTGTVLYKFSGGSWTVSDEELKDFTASDTLSVFP